MLSGRIQVANNVTFKQDKISVSDKKTEIRSDLAKTTTKDSFEKEVKQKGGKKQHKFGKIVLAVSLSLLLIYGSVVLKRKLTKPTFDEIQRCFKEIFEKDLSADEVSSLVEKYKNICKNKNTEEFTKDIIAQLKKDYGIENVATDIKVVKLKDGSLKTILERTEAGNANPLGNINIMPATHNDIITHSVQKDMFCTGFHELKHTKQFADAYCTDPERFVKAILNTVDEKAIVNAIEETKQNILKKAQELKNTTHKSIDIDTIIKDIRRNSGMSTDNDIRNKVMEASKADLRKQLDLRYGKLEKFKPGTPEYEKGLEYISGYEKYTDAVNNYDSYRNNILEKEAWQVSDLAEKIYRYSSSIWKL